MSIYWEDPLQVCSGDKTSQRIVTYIDIKFPKSKCIYLRFLIVVLFNARIVREGLSLILWHQNCFLLWKYFMRCCTIIVSFRAGDTDGSYKVFDVTPPHYAMRIVYARAYYRCPIYDLNCTNFKNRVENDIIVCMVKW